MMSVAVGSLAGTLIEHLSILTGDILKSLSEAFEKPIRNEGCLKLTSAVQVEVQINWCYALRPKEAFFLFPDGMQHRCEAADNFFSICPHTAT